MNKEAIQHCRHQFIVRSKSCRNESFHTERSTVVNYLVIPLRTAINVQYLISLKLKNYCQQMTDDIPHLISLAAAYQLTSLWTKLAVMQVQQAD